jgi:hypothetical protein
LGPIKPVLASGKHTRRQKMLRTRGPLTLILQQGGTRDGRSLVIATVGINETPDV